jgi:hypothetical protein
MTVNECFKTLEIHAKSLSASLRPRLTSNTVILGICGNSSNRRLIVQKSGE